MSQKKIIICSPQATVIDKVKSEISNQYNQIIVCSPKHSLISILNKHSENENIIILYHLNSALKDDTLRQEEIKLGLFIKQNSIAQKVIVLVNRPNTEQGIRLLHLGVRGYANTFINQSKLLTAIEVVFQGEIWAGQDILNKLLTFTLQSNASKESKEINLSIDKQILKEEYQELSSREKAVIEHILLGETNKEIANKLFVTERTVKAHLSSIFKKTQTKNRFELSVKFSKM
ncbi:MAG: response regulator transcription factor [Gammaproteobacteria bacterium]|nr:response regulator transcription factor [Gammaproteobacteria bacterium]